VRVTHTIGGKKMSHFQKKEGKIQRIGYKAGLLVVWMLTIDIVIIVGLCIFMSRNLSMEMLQNECISGTNMLAYYLENSPEIEDKTKLLDDLKKQTGYEFTIFDGDVRAYTTVEQDGKRVTGTKMSSEVVNTVIKQRQPYIGPTTIVGIKHVCSYIPITYSDGTQGTIFAGIPKTKATAHLNITIIIACIASAVLILVSLMILTAYLKRAVSFPLAKLTNVAKTMEKGELNFEQKDLNIQSRDEIGILAHSFESTRIRLKDYIEEISTILKQISNGNLTIATTQDYIGDFVSIKKSLNFIIEHLNDIMIQITESSDQVSNGSEQMAIAANSLSQGAV